MTLNFKAPRYQQFDSNGDPAAGAKLYFYDAGTSTPRAVYSDDGLSSAITQPVTADSAGLFVQIFIQTGAYRAVCTNSSGSVTFFDEDDIDPSLSTGAGALAVASGGTGATTAAGARTNLAVPSQTAFDALELRMDDVEALLDAPILAADDAQTFNASLTPVFTTFETRAVTLTDNVTINAPTVTDGQKIRLILIQDATGSRVATWNSAYKWHGGVAGVLSTTANAIDVLEGYARTTGEIQVTSFKRQDDPSNQINEFTEYSIANPFVVGTVYTQAHGLAAYPALVTAYIQCVTTDLGWSVGDRIDVHDFIDGAANSERSVIGFNTTNAYIITGDSVPRINNFSTTAQAAITAANWRLYMRVYKR